MSLEARVFAIERPHPNLMTSYVIKALLALPLLPVLLPYLWFRYHTLRYRFDPEGVSMRWGILFRREIHLTYSRIQDIHLSSGLIQRWLGLADIQIQTASGSAQAEMTIEGLLEHELVRDFLYQKMRGLRDFGAPRTAREDVSPDEATVPGGGRVQALLEEILAEVRAAREAVQRRAP